MISTHRRIFVLGAGALGIAACHEFLNAGETVVLLDAAESSAGLAQNQELSGVNINRFYHFLSHNDSRALETFLNDIQVKHTIVWKNISTSTYTEGRFHSFDKFSEVMGLAEEYFPSLLFTLLRLRVFKPSKKFDSINAIQWARSSFGPKFADKVWLPLLEEKFGIAAANISAYWLASRIRQHLRTKEYFFGKCKCGYLVESYRPMFDKVTARLATSESQSQAVFNQHLVDIKISQNKVKLLRMKSGNSFELGDQDIFVSTIPLALLRNCFDIPNPNFSYLSPFKLVDIIQLSMFIKTKLSDDFWTTISEKNFPFQVIVQQNRLYPLSQNELVYLSKYNFKDSSLYNMDDEEIFQKFFSALQAIFPHLKLPDLISYSVSRSQAAAPVPELGTDNSLPDFRSPIPNFYHAGFEHIYPNDRGVGNSLLIGRKLAKRVLSDLNEIS